MSSAASAANVTILRQFLRVVSLPLAHRERAAHMLLRMFFFRDETSWFVALTETPDEISLLIEDSTLARLQALYRDAVDFKVGAHVWRALEVSLTNATSASPALAPPLSDAGISIMYHSSLNSDYLLVPDRQLSSAVAALERVGVSISFENEDEEQLCNAVAQQQQQQQQQQQPPLRHFGARPVIEIPRQSCVAGFLQVDQLEAASLALVQALLFPADPDRKRFLSVTQTPDGLSYIVPADGDQQRSSVWETFSVGLWSPVKVQGPLDFDTCGYVSSLSCALSSTNLPTIYISTYYTDYALVQEPVLPEKVLTALAQTFDISDHSDF